MAVSSVKYNKPVLPRTSDGSDLGSNRASIYSGKALSFDGVNDYVRGSNIRVQSMNVGWTISMYVNPSTYSAPGYLFDFREGSFDGYSVYTTGSSDGKISLNFYDNNQSHTTGYFLPENQWSLLTFKKFDADYISIFLDGELITSIYSNATYNVSGDFFIGCRFTLGNYFNGDISDFRVYEKILTDEQIRELYQNPEQTIPTGLEATDLTLHLPMTEGAGSVAYNANAGAIGTELISNAGFDETCQKWGTTDSSTVEISGGKAIWTNAPLSGSFVEQPLDLEVGKFYRVSFDYTSTAFNLFVNLGDTQQAVPLGNGRFTYDMYYGTGTSSLKFKHGYTSDSSASVDNVSVKEVVPSYYNGTISGATWVSGLPEPLPQTALMDWNKVDINTSVNQNDYYSGNITIGSSSGTIICRHIPYTKTNGVYYYGLGSSSTGYQRAIGSNSNNYWSVGFGSNSQDFTTNAPVDLGDVTDISNSWDADHNVTIHKNGNFIQTASKTLADITGTRSVYLYKSAWANGNEQAIVFWAYYDRKLTTKEINDVYTGAVDPEDVADLKYFFSKSNGYSYNGVTLTKTGSFTEQLSSEGSTAGKDVFGNTITNRRASGAYNFDRQDSNVRIDKNASLNVSSLSVEAWVYPKKSGYQSIFQTGNVNGGFHYYAGSSVLTQRLYVNGSTTNASTYLTRNAWNHIVAVHDGATTKYYLNGVLDVSTNNATGGANSMPLTQAWLGTNDSIGEQNEFQCANPRLYNYALTAQQVADNFNEKASTFGGTKVASELDAYIERTASDGATVEAHSCLVNYLTELDKK